MVEKKTDKKHFTLDPANESVQVLNGYLNDQKAVNSHKGDIDSLKETLWNTVTAEQGTTDIILDLPDFIIYGSYKETKTIKLDDMISLDVDYKDKLVSLRADAVKEAEKKAREAVLKAPMTTEEAKAIALSAGISIAVVDIVIDAMTETTRDLLSVAAKAKGRGTKN